MYALVAAACLLRAASAACVFTQTCDFTQNDCAPEAIDPIPPFPRPSPGPDDPPFDFVCPE